MILMYYMINCNVLVIRNDGYWILVLGRLLLFYWVGRFKFCLLFLFKGNVLF